MDREDYLAEKNREYIKSRSNQESIDIKNKKARDRYALNIEAQRARGRAKVRPRTDEKRSEENESRLKKKEDIAGRSISSLCESCSKPESCYINGKIKRLALDHCHATGEFRGWLCSR